MDSTLLSQMRSGHNILLQAYNHLLDKATSPTCSRCREAEHTLHWSTGCIAPALYKVGWRFLAPHNNCYGEIGHAGKAYFVTSWCKHHHSNNNSGSVSTDRSPVIVRHVVDCEVKISWAPCGLRGCKNGPDPFPGRMSYKATKPALISVLYLSMRYMVLLFIRAPFYVLLVFIAVCSVSWLF